MVDIRGTGFNLLGDHFQPIVGLIAPVFLIFPSAVTLLMVQALLTAVSVVPVSRAAAARLGTGAGRMIGAAYGLSWGLQQMIDFDFHEIAFAVPLLACSLSALLRGKVRAAALWALPLVFVKEDQGFTVAALGVVIVVMSLTRARQASRARGGLDRGALGWGALLIVWGLAWSLLAIAVIIPHFNPLHQYPYWTDGGVLSPGGVTSLAAGGARPAGPLLRAEAADHPAHPAAGGVPRAGLPARPGGRCPAWRCGSCPRTPPTGGRGTTTTPR